MSEVPDPTEIHKAAINRLTDFYTEGVCMGCHKSVNYELACCGPNGAGPALCVECYPEGHGLQFETSDTFVPGREMWRCITIELYGPWCVSREDALRQWQRVSQGLQPDCKPL